MYRSLCRRVAVNLPFACTALAMFTLNPSVEAAELKFDPAHAKSPLPVASASIELLRQPTSAGNAVVRMQFADRRSKAPVVIQGGLGPTQLRDDGIAPDTRAGDGLYAAFVQVNAEQFSRMQQRRIELASKYRTLPVFGVQRELLRYEAFEPSRNVTLAPGIPSILDKFKGVPFVVDPARELLVTSTLVVEDQQRTYDACSGNGTQMGAWTFGKLVTEIANEPVTGIHPADLAETWLNQWKSNLSINGFNVPQRALGAQRLLDSWPRVNGKLDLARAPFRLLAIVNRQDLRGNTLYGSGDAGEARLVFGALNCGSIVTSPPTPQAMPFTVIFEYGIRKNSCTGVRNWAQQWRDLGTLVLGSPAYNTALQTLTDQFTLRNANPAQLPNRSAINQVRTNEFALADMPVDIFWQLREGKLQSSGSSAGLLLHATIAQTPDRSLLSTAALRDFINGNEAAILAGTHHVPLHYPAVVSPFRGGHIDVGAGFTWSAPGVVNPEAAKQFTLATCSGCHAPPFLHIEPRPLGAESEISSFLAKDLLSRQQKLEATASMSCLKVTDFPVEEIFFEPLRPVFVH